MRDEGEEEAAEREKRMGREKKEEELWCHFEYEFLPDFCYTCGMLDHIDKDCNIKLGRGESQQYGSWLKAYIPRRGGEGNRGSWGGGLGWEV